MGNPLHFIQASDTSAFAALHTEQGALPSQYEALQAYLKKIGLGRFGTLWAEPVTGQATPAGYASISCIRRWKASAPPSPASTREKPNRRGLPCAGRGKPSPPISTTRPAASAPQGAVHPFGGQCLRRQRPSRARQLGPAPARHGRSHGPDTLGRAGKRGNALRCDWSGNGCNGSFRRSGCRDGGTQCRSRCGPCGWPFRRNKNSGRDRNGGRNRRRYCRGNGGKRHHPA